MGDAFEDRVDGLVPVTLELPVGLLAAYDALVDERIYPTRETALLHGLVESWRHNMGSFHIVRVDLAGETRKGDHDGENDPSRAETSGPAESGAGES